MKSFITANIILGLTATVLASTGLDESRSLEKKSTEIEVTLCNDFHGGAPCQTYDAWPGSCGE